MMRRNLRTDSRAIATTEFAFAAPLLLGMVIGVTQLGQLFFANAGIQHTVEQAARFAAVYPSPEREEVIAKIHEGQVGMRGTLSPVVTAGEDEDDRPIFTISLAYRVPLDFIFFETPPVTLEHSRVVYRQLVEAVPAEDEDEEGETPGEGGTPGSDTGTDTGGDTGTDTGGNGGGNGNNGGGKGK